MTPSPLPSDVARRDPLPFLTANIAGVGGTLKHQPEDFVVEEIPAYDASGEGEHLFLWVEKRDLSAENLIRHVASRLSIAHGDVGCGGMKDRHAVTRQFLSVPARCESKIGEIDSDRVRVLSAQRHGNKLRTGHLHGNRFNVFIRAVRRDSFRDAERIVEAIRRRGFPNYFGDQRFGYDGETLDLGLALLRGAKRPGDIPYARRRFLLRMALSSVQSALFNDLLAARMLERQLHTVHAGDVMQVRATGGPFVAEDAAIEQARFDAGETVITGPLFGPKMKQPVGAAAKHEQRVLDAWHLTAEHFTRFDNLTSGARRPFLIWPEEIGLAEERGGLRVRFALPSGVYATTLLGELMKI
jgi:tRNA pseudouridine13 synthase